jgi:hypothetical protein
VLKSDVEEQLEKICRKEQVIGKNAGKSGKEGSSKDKQLV